MESHDLTWSHMILAGESHELAGESHDLAVESHDVMVGILTASVPSAGRVARVRSRLLAANSPSWMLLPRARWASRS